MLLKVSCGHASVQWKLCKPNEDAKYCSLQKNISSLLSQPVPAEDGRWGCMHVSIEQFVLSFHSEERQPILGTTNSVLPLQLFAKGWHMAPQRRRGLEKCQVT